MVRVFDSCSFVRFVGSLLLVASTALGQGSKISFDAQGNTIVNGKPFFPIGIYVYDLSPDVMKDIKSKGFNVVIGNGFRADQFDFLHQNKMMAVPFSTPEFVEKVKDHPALLAWYLVDEPEGHGHTPDGVKQAYAHLKAKDKDHPIGLCHFLYEALLTFKEGCDFTMTDVYPVTANRDVPMKNVGIHMDYARAVHENANWPHWTYIQDFGGPDTDGGKWAQPTAAEVRCMTFIALVHRANGILIFSYWPKAPAMWNSIGGLNRDVAKIAPWVMAKGTEVSAKVSTEQVQARARKVGESWIIIAVNTERTPIDATITVDGLGDVELKSLVNAKRMTATGGKLEAHFAPAEAMAFTVGPAPRDGSFLQSSTSP
jgi:hypothetical protein